MVIINPRSTEHAVKSSMTDDGSEAESSQDVAERGGGWCLGKYLPKDE